MRPAVFLTAAALAFSVMQAPVAAAQAEEEGSSSRFSKYGLSFDFVEGMKIEAEREGPNVNVSIEGDDDLLVTIQVFKLPVLKGEDFAEAIITGMREGFEESGLSVTALEPSERHIGGKERSGHTFTFASVEDAPLRFSGYGYEKSGRTIMVGIQHAVGAETQVQEPVETILDSLEYKK